MEALCVQPWEKDLVIGEGERVPRRRGLEEEGAEAPSPTCSDTDEDTDEDEEPEPPQVPRRKVSFADAFGLNLVSVKEFDNAEAAESYENPPPGRDVSLPVEELFVSCLFTVPSSPEELDQRLREQMVELESIELLPGTTTVRGNVRVVNLCYTKSVHVRMSLDRWVTHFDLSADYVPGSSDMRTDRFTFTYALVPPVQAEGTRVELCLRYETPLGTFWANNQGMNYVLFCSKKVPVNGPQGQEDGKSKRSCLRPSRRPSAEGTCPQPGDMLTDFTEAAWKAEKDREAFRRAELQSLSYQKSLVDAVKSRRRETRMARVQDFVTQQRFPKAPSQEVDQPLQSVWAVSGGLLSRGQTSPRVLTYHEIPLLTLDWTSAKACTWGGAQAGEEEAAVDSRGNLLSPGNSPKVPGKAWDTKASSVCDVWQAFLTGSTSGDHSGVFESEWLQTATSVSPSDRPRTPSASDEGGTRVSGLGDDMSKQASKCPADRWDESQMIGQARGGSIERMAEEAFTPPTADVEAGVSEESESADPSRFTGGSSRKDRSRFSRPVETSADGICPSRAESLIQSPVGSEGSGDGAAVSGNSEALKDAGVETSDGSSKGTERMTGEGLGIVQQRDGDQQRPGEALQTRRGENNRMPEAAQKPEEEEEEEKEDEEEEEEEEEDLQKEDVEFGQQGSVLTHEEGRGPASEGRTKEQEVNSGTQTREAQVVSHGDGETIRPLSNEESTADVGETRWLLSQDALVSREEDKSNKTIKEADAQRPETSGRTEEDMSLRVKTEEQRELGGHENTRVEAGDRPAEARSSSCEYEGTRDVDAVHLMEPELKRAIIRKFGDDLVQAILEDVFKTPQNDLSVDGRVDTADEASQALLHQEELAPFTDLHPRLLQEDGSPALTSPGHVPSAFPGPSVQQERPESHSLVWWSVFYVLGHITRLAVISGLVLGLFLYFFLCDFPAFFAVYMFSLCCWFYKWKRRRAAKVEGMEGWHTPCVQTGEML